LKKIAKNGLKYSNVPATSSAEEPRHAFLFEFLCDSLNPEIPMSAICGLARVNGLAFVADISNIIHSVPTFTKPDLNIPDSQQKITVATVS